MGKNVETYSLSNAVASHPEERVKLNKLKNNTTNCIAPTMKRPKEKREKLKKICANELVVAPLNKGGKETKQL